MPTDLAQTVSPRFGAISEDAHGTAKHASPAQTTVPELTCANSPRQRSPCVDFDPTLCRISGLSVCDRGVMWTLFTWLGGEQFVSPKSSKAFLLAKRARG